MHRIIKKTCLAIFSPASRDKRLLDTWSVFDCLDCEKSRRNTADLSSTLCYGTILWENNCSSEMFYTTW